MELGDRLGLADSGAGLGLLDQLHNLIAVCRKDRILHLNKAGMAMLGFATLEDVVNTPIANFFHSDYREFAALGLDIFAEEEGLISSKFMRADGAEVDVELWVSTITLDGEPAHMLEARDISAHLRAARQVHEREKRLEGILNTVADGIVSVDDRGVIQAFNPAAERMFGFTAKEAIGQNIRALLPEPVTQRIDGRSPDELAPDWVQVLGPQGEVIGKRKEGTTFPMEVALRELRQGDARTFTGIMRDITKRKEAEARIRHMAHHDNLTGLPNRYLFGDRLEEAVKRANRHRRKAALMFVDLDKFKPINDELGHAAGDTALQEAAKRLVAAVRGTDTVARVGGDEFVVILEDLDGAYQAEVVADKILEAMTDPMDLDGKMRTLGASIGISICPDHAIDAEGVMRCADEAMYLAKESGRNCWRTFSGGGDPTAPRLIAGAARSPL